MNNKILIGSIIAVAIFIGVSFTSVVGYRSIESNIGVSPLFNIRSSRAIDEESEELSCAYVGKGEESILLIPKRDDRIELAQKVIDAIRIMDEVTYNNFKGLVINHLKHVDNIKDESICKTISFLEHLRDKDIKPANYLMLFNEIDSENILPTGGQYTMQCETFCGGPCVEITVDTPIICLLLFFLFLAALPIILIFISILVIPIIIYLVTLFSGCIIYCPI